MQLQSNSEKLTPGQILQGKVLRLFPDNKAQIQLGSQVLIAQLAASLSAGEKYHFQVQAVDEVTHLKVLGEKVDTQSSFRNQIADLMGQLALTQKRSHVDLLQLLVKEDIIFNRNQLVKAFQLYDKSSNKQVAQQVIKELFTRNLPMTEAVYEAIKATKTNTLSEKLNLFLKQLNQIHDPSLIETAARERVSNLLGHTMAQHFNEETIINNLQHPSMYKDKAIFNLLKLNGVIEQNITFSEWISKWDAFANIKNKQMGTNEFPFKLHLDPAELVSQPFRSTVKLETQSQIILNHWRNEINNVTTRQLPMTEESFILFKNEVAKRLTPLLMSHQQKQINNMVQNDSISLANLFSVLQTLANEQSSMKLEQVFQENKHQNQKVPIQSQLLEQIGQMLRLSGLTYENVLVQDHTAVNLNTLKPLLIQLINNKSTVQDQAQQLLHLVNGLQIQSINETSNFIQASIQIPGEKFGLNKEMFVEFESKKLEDGKIDPDYCRILFYLDLETLRETVIDMQIQKRLISITVYNDHKKMKDQSTLFEPLLKEGLEVHNYKLSRISVQPLTERVKQENKAVKELDPISYEGFDYLV